MTLQAPCQQQEEESREEIRQTDFLPLSLDKAVSTEDLIFEEMPSCVITNELLRLEAALNAVIAATSPPEEEDDRVPVMAPPPQRRARSHSHHHCGTGLYLDPSLQHLNRRSASVSMGAGGGHFLCSHHAALLAAAASGPSPGPSTLSSDHLCLPVPEEALTGSRKGDGTGKRGGGKKRRKKRPRIASVVKVVDPEELPRRARWTIVATACLLLFMCFMLVGVTLRMAPIIDEMVRKENDEFMRSMNRAVTIQYNQTTFLTSSDNNNSSTSSLPGGSTNDSSEFPTTISGSGSSGLNSLTSSSLTSEIINNNSSSSSLSTENNNNGSTSHQSETPMSTSPPLQSSSSSINTSNQQKSSVSSTNSETISNQDKSSTSTILAPDTPP